MMRDLLAAAHPKLWPYAGFLFAFGAILARAPVTPALLAYGAWFTIFGSALGFLINNYFDRALDAHNPRKEPLALSPKGYAFGIAGCLLAFGAAQAAFLSAPVLACACIAIGTNLLYSVPPVRLKEVPLLDILVGPGSFLSILCAGYLLGGGTLSLLPLLAGMAFFSAVELAHKSLDIEADLRGGARTSAVMLGRGWSIAAATGLLALSGGLVGIADPQRAWATFPYVLVMFLLLGATDDEKRKRLEKALPWCYVAAGFVVTAAFLALY